MENDLYYLAGDTVRLVGTFFDWEGQLMTPDEITLTIYDYRWVQKDQFLIDSTSQDSNGAFVYDYVFDQVGTYYYEWKGLMTGGTPNLEREEIHIKQI